MTERDMGPPGPEDVEPAGASRMETPGPDPVTADLQDVGAGDPSAASSGAAVTAWPPPGTPADTAELGKVLGTVGDITFSAVTINVPGRSFPIAGSIWTVRDQSRVENRIPPYAIVLAIIFALACLLGLLFLLIREQVTVGYVEVEVRTKSDYHVCQVPVSSQFDIMQVRSKVDYARTLSTWAASQAG